MLPVCPAAACGASQSGRRIVTGAASLRRSAAIQTAGLLGDQFIALEPGADEKFLDSGATIAFTTNALSIESLISKFVASSDSGDGEKKKK